jgi:ureidoglycolate dehydrogenase (NAD+)
VPRQKHKEISMKDTVVVPWQDLWQFTKDIFLQVGLSPEEAEIEADVLVWANLRGVDSHGVRAIPLYVKMVQDGFFKTDAQVRTVHETPAVLVVDGDHGFGPVITVHAMEHVMAKARQVGFAWGFLRNITHQGAIGYYALMAAKENMAGLAWVCGGPNMAPYGARARGTHNSPIAIAVPGNEHPPLILDMATSVVAYGKLRVAIDKGEAIPDTWALDEDGQPITDAQDVAMLCPTGGYKGSGLALMFECLSSLLVGVPMLAPQLLDLEAKPPRGTQNGIVAAIDIGALTDIDGYKEEIDRLAGAIKALPKAEGFEHVFVPGEPEDRYREQRERDGIPLPEPVASSLREVAAELGVELPAAMDAG